MKELGCIYWGGGAVAALSREQLQTRVQLPDNVGLSGQPWDQQIEWVRAPIACEFEHLRSLSVGDIWSQGKLQVEIVAGKQLCTFNPELPTDWSMFKTQGYFLCNTSLDIVIGNVRRYLRTARRSSGGNLGGATAPN